MLYLEYSRNPNKWSNTIAGDSQLSVHTPPKFLVPLFVGKSRKLESKGGRPLKKKKKISRFSEYLGLQSVRDFQRNSAPVSMGFQANSYKDATEQTYVQLNSATQVAIILQILLNLLEK